MTNALDTPTQAAATLSFRRAVWTALKVAVLGSVLLGAIECTAVACVTMRHFEGGWRPIGLVLAGTGKASVTYLLVWAAVISIVAAGYARAMRDRADAAPEPFLGAAFILLAGTTVAAIDLPLVASAGPAKTVAACVAVALAAVAVYYVLRRIVRAGGAAGCRRGLNVLAGLAAVAAVLTGAFFARSPFFNPSTFRVADPAGRAAAPRSPHVLWIVLDTARADHLSCYGYARPTTPFLDAFARSATVFERAVANGIWTVPSHAAMFTGLPTRAHGADHFHLWLEDEFPTAAERLAAAGYATASFSNNAWISRDTNLARGFATCRAMRFVPRLGRFSLDYLAERLGYSALLPWLDGDNGAAVTNQVVGEWLDEQAGGGKPVFVFVNYMEAHLPYRVPNAYRRMMMTPQQAARSYDLRFRAYGNIATTMCFRFNMEDPAFLPESDREVLKRQYDAALRYLDDRVGELVGMFAARGMLDDTLVIVSSDHGEYLDTHGLWEHRYLTYDDVARAALLIRFPGDDRPRRVAAPVQLSDLYATVLAAALGAEAGDEPYAPRDLRAFARDAAEDRVAFVEYNGPIPINFQPDPRQARLDAHREQPQVAAHDGRFKYIASADGERELYDVLADPGELHNLLGTHTEAAARLADSVRAWKQAVPQYVPPQRPGAEGLDPDLQRALRDLGYLGGAESVPASRDIRGVDAGSSSDADSSGPAD